MVGRIRWARLAVDILLYAFLLALSLFMIIPFLWMLTTSLKPPDEIFGFPPILISARSSLDSYVYVIEKYNVPRVLVNTFAVAGIATILQLVFCSLGGYGFAKYSFPGRKWLFGFMLAMLVVPFAILMVPLYLVIRDLAWIDSFQALTIPFAANAFGIFFMRQYISTISNELLDAARIDGCNELGIYARIIFPIIIPGLTSLGIIVFMGTWNSFLWPLVVLKSPDNFTIPLTISQMTGQAGRTAYNAQMAVATMSILPLLIIFLIFQRRFVEGITAGALKG